MIYSPMLFNSYPFLFLVLITFSLYYLPRVRSLQLYILIISSFVFYSYSAPLLLLLLIISGTINAVSSYVIYHESEVKRQKQAAVIGVVFNILILVAFKYNGMLGSAMVDALSMEKEALE